MVGAVDTKRAADLYAEGRTLRQIGELGVAWTAVGHQLRHLVLAKPNVIMNGIRLRGLGVAGREAAGRKSPHNQRPDGTEPETHTRNAAAGGRLIQAEGLDTKSATAVAASLADTLEELHRLKRSLDRRVRRDPVAPDCGPGAEDTNSRPTPHVRGNAGRRTTELEPMAEPC
jgi:hypothetical protein